MGSWAELYWVSNLEWKHTAYQRGLLDIGNQEVTLEDNCEEPWGFTSQCFMCVQNSTL